MKTKSFVKRLSLNKKTVANLGNKEMEGIYGGDTENSVCQTNCVTNCICEIRTFKSQCCY
jgi:hypothetical protein